MSELKDDREYDIVLVGATGYTGILTAEHVAEHLPTNLKWSIAGRSGAKLEALATRLKKLAPERLQPAIETVDFKDQTQLVDVVKKARLCISLVAYHHVGPEVIEACIEGRTDYIDTSGTIPRIRDWIDKYHAAAESAGVAVIISCGALSGPQDLLALSTVRALQQATSLKTKEFILSVINMPSDPSGGTVESLMLRGEFSAKIQHESQQPWFLSPIAGRAKTSSSTNIFGARHDRTLGTLSASSLHEVQNTAIIHRTWGLLGSEYGPNFHYSEYRKASSTLVGIFQILNTKSIGWMLAIPPLRAIASMVLPTPGSGPDPAKEKSYVVELEAVAIADVEEDEKTPAPRAYSHYKYPGGPYHETAAFMAQGAASLLYERTLEGGVKGGCLTPAFLGEDLIERMRGLGADFSTKML